MYISLKGALYHYLKPLNGIYTEGGKLQVNSSLKSLIAWVVNAV